VPVERLRGEPFGRHLIRLWEEAAAALDAHCATPPELRNTDGEFFLLTTDHFEIAPGARASVEAQLGALPGADPPDPGEKQPVYVFTRPGNALNPSLDNTVIGHAIFTGSTLRLETNSRERADALRERVEAACGDGIRHRAREHADPLSKRAAPLERNTAPEPPPPEAAQLILDFKRSHYAGWPDLPLPALRGKTPREAIRTARGRASVDVLLKEMENLEQRSAAGAAFDFSELRRALGLD